MRVLIGYDGSTYSDAAVNDLQRAGLPGDVEELVVSVRDAPIIPPLASHEVTEEATLKPCLNEPIWLPAIGRLA